MLLESFWNQNELTGYFFSLFSLTDAMIYCRRSSLTQKKVKSHAHGVALLQKAVVSDQFSGKKLRDNVE